jgi:hypothetical protein
VLVVLELADAFYADMTWRGAVAFVALFVALWFSWVGFTLYANRFDTDDVLFRIAQPATMAVAGCAAAATGVTGEFSTAFAVSFLLGRVVLLLLLVRAWRHVPQARPTVSVYLGSTALSAALWAVSLAIGGPARRPASPLTPWRQDQGTFANAGHTDAAFLEVQRHSGVSWEADADPAGDSPHGLLCRPIRSASAVLSSTSPRSSRSRGSGRQIAIPTRRRTWCAQQSSLP